MSKKTIYVCVQKDIVNPINWALKEFEKLVSVKYFDTLKQLDVALANNDCTALILDSVIVNEPSIEFAQKLKKDFPSLKILLIASSGTSKQELIGIIQLKIVSGVLMRPFNAEQISDYIYKLCNFPKAEDVPWYMKTGIK